MCIRDRLQPIADAVKLMFKEIIIPTRASRFLFVLAPMLSFAPALAAWAVVPFGDGMMISHLDAGLLYLLALTSLGVYGVIIAGWSSNSKYAFLGAMRSVSYTHLDVYKRQPSGVPAKNAPGRSGISSQSRLNRQLSARDLITLAPAPPRG